MVGKLGMKEEMFEVVDVLGEDCRKWRDIVKERIIKKWEIVL